MALLEKFAPDNLIADDKHTLAVGTVTVKAEEGALKRGTILMRDSNNKFVVANTSAGTAEVILAEDVDATSAAAVAKVYVSGDFKAESLIVASGYTLAEADIVSLKNAGIYIVAGVSENPS